MPDGKTVSAEFYKGVMNGLLKQIQRVRPAAFCCRDFFLLHDNTPAPKPVSFCQFLTPKLLQPFITPCALQIYLRQTAVCYASWKLCWKQSNLRIFLWPRRSKWWMKEGQKRGIFGIFSEIIQRRKSPYICQWSLFWIKNTVYVFLMCLRFLNRSILKPFGPHCVYGCLCRCLFSIPIQVHGCEQDKFY